MTAPPLSDRRAWRSELRTFMDGGVRRPLRMVAFATGWLASADSASGPTLAADQSPFLAAWRALEPMGMDLVEAIAIVGTVPRATLPETGSSRSGPGR